MKQITLPVTVDYNPDQVIGEITLDADQLPKFANFVSAIGGTTKGLRKTAEGTYEHTDFTLTEVTLLPEDRYDWPRRPHPPMKDPRDPLGDTFERA